jgi:hypothetical protein
MQLTVLSEVARSVPGGRDEEMERHRPEAYGAPATNAPPARLPEPEEVRRRTLAPLVWVGAGAVALAAFLLQLLL